MIGEEEINFFKGKFVRVIKTDPHPTHGFLEKINKGTILLERKGKREIVAINKIVSIAECSPKW